MTVVKVAVQGTILSIGALTLGTTVLKSLFLALRSSTLAAATAQRVLNVVMKAKPSRNINIRHNDFGRCICDCICCV